MKSKLNLILVQFCGTDSGLSSKTFGAKGLKINCSIYKIICVYESQLTLNVIFVLVEHSPVHTLCYLYILRG